VSARRTACALLLLLGALGAGAGEVAPVGEAWSATVVSNIDGDTLHATRQVGGKMVDQKLRLWGIDAPERGQPLAREATALLTQLCAGQVLTARVMGHPSYGRPVVRLTLADGRDVARELLLAGLVRHLVAFAPHEAPYAAAQAARHGG
jgi:endonuclease YncB( thermonuclease family)